MAIDSAKKRGGIAGIVRPDGTIDQADRQTVAGIYGGIAAESSSSLCGTLTNAILLSGALSNSIIMSGTLANTNLLNGTMANTAC